MSFLPWRSWRSWRSWRESFLILLRYRNECSHSQLRLADVAEYGRAAQPFVFDADRHAREHIATELVDELAVARAELQLPVARHRDGFPRRREAAHVFSAGELLVAHSCDQLLCAVVSRQRVDVVGCRFDRRLERDVHAAVSHHVRAAPRTDLQRFARA